MPAYHSRYVSEEWLSTNEAFPEVCSCAVCPLRTELKGPAPPAEGEDIIDETLMYFRANVLFRNFDVRGGADRTLIYLTLYTVQCLVKCEKIEDKPTALRELKNLATKQFLCPGDAGWPLGGLFPAPKNKTETGALSPLDTTSHFAVPLTRSLMLLLVADQFRAYFKQARDELGVRLMDKLFNEDGSKNKWWQAFSKRRFMGKELVDK
jgi:actin related protein 2/3 complex, subunit 3